MTKRRVALILLLAGFAAVGWWRFGTRIVPAGQPALVTLDAATIATLRDDFNRAQDSVRIVTLLSPT